MKYPDINIQIKYLNKLINADTPELPIDKICITSGVCHNVFHENLIWHEKEKQ